MEVSNPVHMNPGYMLYIWSIAGQQQFLLEHVKPWQQFGALGVMLFYCSRVLILEILAIFFILKCISEQAS